jgi:adenylate cyclase
MQATVLFADLSGTSRLIEIGGEAAARKAATRCIERLSRAAEAAGGKVVRTRGDALMALFPSADAAALAATAMHATIDALPAVGDVKLGVQVGFHSGPVDLRGGEPDETVKFAARLLEEARKGQTLTSLKTAALLGSGFRVTPAGDPEVCEVLTGEPTIVQLVCRDQAVTVSHEVESVSIGRERGCGIVVEDRMASRRHCTITMRHDGFVLRDHSSNGTLVRMQGERDVYLHGQELRLRGRGMIFFGPQPFHDSDRVEFRCA